MFMSKQEKKQLKFEKMANSGVGSRASARRKALKHIFDDRPMYILEIDLVEFLGRMGFPKYEKMSVRNDMRKFGYRMINHHWGARQDMAVLVRDAHGFMVKTWVYIDGKKEYSRESLDEFLVPRQVLNDGHS